MFERQSFWFFIKCYLECNSQPGLQPFCTSDALDFTRLTGYFTRSAAVKESLDLSLRASLILSVAEVAAFAKPGC